MTEAASPARQAAAAAAVQLVEEGMTIGLGSGRAVWQVAELLGDRWRGKPPLRAAVASERTRARAQAAGIEVVDLDGTLTLDLALDGADEIDSQLRMIKGGGGAMLRERIVIAAAKRFVVVAEQEKLVERLGVRVRLPVEIARFGWRDTRRRLADILPAPELRLSGDSPYLTAEGHRILDCALPEGLDPDTLVRDLAQTPGVLEHGLFVGVAERALLGTEAAEVEELRAS